jgi:hypothetical protein
MNRVRAVDAETVQDEGRRRPAYRVSRPTRELLSCWSSGRALDGDAFTGCEQKQTTLLAALGERMLDPCRPFGQLLPAIDVQRNHGPGLEYLRGLRKLARSERQVHVQQTGTCRSPEQHCRVKWSAVIRVCKPI